MYSQKENLIFGELMFSGMASCSATESSGQVLSDWPAEHALGQICLLS